MRPSEENTTLFCARERRMRSFVAAQVIGVARDSVESQPDPMANFFSARWM